MYIKGLLYDNITCCTPGFIPDMQHSSFLESRNIQKNSKQNGLVLENKQNQVMLSGKDFHFSVAYLGQWTMNTQ